MASNENPFYETGIWNVATGYSFDILMYHIYWIDRYELLARRGAMDFNQEISLADNDIKANKISGIEWLYDHLQQLVSGSKFAVKKDDKKTIEELKTSLEDIGKYVSAIKSKKVNQKYNTVTVDFNEKFFSLCLKMLINFKEQLFPILYRANIVFQYKDQHTAAEIKKGFTERLGSSG